jgi:hypothetical protein
MYTMTLMLFKVSLLLAIFYHAKNDLLDSDQHIFFDPVVQLCVPVPKLQYFTSKIFLKALKFVGNFL